MRKEIPLSKKDKATLHRLDKMLEEASLKAESGLISPQSYQTMVHAIGLTFMDLLVYEKLGRIQIQTAESHEELSMQERDQIYGNGYMDGFKHGLAHKAATQLLCDT